VARRPLEREGVYLDGGRRTTQLMRDSLGGATGPMTNNKASLARTLFVAYFIALVATVSSASRLTAQCPILGTDNPCPGLKDSTAARNAVEQYFAALASHELRLQSMSVVRFRPPDTLAVTAQFKDSRGRLLTSVVLTVNSDSGYAVVSFPPPVPE